jgi:hypothetical protein
MVEECRGIDGAADVRQRSLEWVTLIEPHYHEPAGRGRKTHERS